MAFSFYGGIHPKDRKDLAREQAIVAFPPPATVVIPMSQHIGAPCKPLLSKGDHVDLGQKIGDGPGLCAPVHASVSGTVQAVEARPHPNGTTVLSVVIANDFQETVSRRSDPGRTSPVSAPETLWISSGRLGLWVWEAPPSPPT